MKTTLLALFSLLTLSYCTNSEKESDNETAQYIATDEFLKLNMPFGQAVIFDDIIYVSGQVGEDKNGALVEGGIGPETKKTLENIKEILMQNGSSMDKIIKCTCMLDSIDDWAQMSAEYVKFFPDHKPARSAFATNGLALGAKVEIECMAYISKK